MSIAVPPILYREQPGRCTAPAEIDRAVAELSRGQTQYAACDLAERIRLIEACIEGTVRTAESWVSAACQAKRVAIGSAAGSEEVAAGPLAVCRYLRLLRESITDVQQFGHPRLPGQVYTSAEGRLRAAVFPSKSLYDAQLFRGFRAEVWFQEGVTPGELWRHLPKSLYSAAQGVSLVLGAGNVSSIPPIDAFARLFQSGRAVLLKMNPVNEYLGPIYERAYAAAIQANLLRIIYGGAETGGYALRQPAVADVHITGSVFTHDQIVWGPPGADRDSRQAAGDPLLKKEISSELGNVTPWVIAPGRYSPSELAFQAENVAAAIVNNASFNCIAVKVIVTWRRWPQRTQFLDAIDSVLASVPRRNAYYPGAGERLARFTGHAEPPDEQGSLPWTLVRDVDPDREPRWFEEESFVCACVETSLDAESEQQFLARAVDFCNARLWGTLGAAITVPRTFTRRPDGVQALEQAVTRLRYGAVAINHWPAISYALMTTPWGGYPGATLRDPQSGLGWVHNTYLLEGVEKCVLMGPLTLWPKPFWFPTHRRAAALARQVLRLYHRPSWSKLPGLLLSAVRG